MSLSCLSLPTCNTENNYMHLFCKSFMFFEIYLKTSYCSHSILLYICSLYLSPTLCLKSFIACKETNIFCWWLYSVLSKLDLGFRSVNGLHKHNFFSFSSFYWLIWRSWCSASYTKNYNYASIGLWFLNWENSHILTSCIYIQVF